MFETIESIRCTLRVEEFFKFAINLGHIAMACFQGWLIAFNPNPNSFDLCLGLDCIRSHFSSGGVSVKLSGE